MIINIWINCPSEEVADEIAQVLLEQRLIAASNRYPAITSRYVWEEKVEESTEIPLLVKTRTELFGDIVTAATALHPYETPSIIATKITAANPAYIEWVNQVTAAPI